MTLSIRNFQPKDLDCLIDLATISFAEEYVAHGMSPDTFARQIRTVTKGRLIPFKVLSAISGYKWEIFVAEIEGQVVGCGGYLGRKRMELANLMVHPSYRRRGVGQALLEHRLRRLAALDYPLVTTTILADNKASLGNVRKQGFETFDSYTILEIPLPLPSPPGNKVTVAAHPLRSTDQDAFMEIETQTTTTLWQQIEGSARERYFLKTSDQLMNRLNSAQSWIRVFATGEEVVGFLAARTTSGQTKGSVSRPIIADEHIHHLPEMLQETAVWLAALGKQKMQIAVPNSRPLLLSLLKEQGWQQGQSWVRLVKWLNQQPGSGK